MCLEIKKYKYTKEEALNLSKSEMKIAKKDIIVYKHLRENGKSPYRNFTYKKGYHYYQTGKPFTFKVEQTWSIYTCSVYRGLHSYTTYSEGLIEMTIPKGSKYFTNGNEIVSDNLIWY